MSNPLQPFHITLKDAGQRLDEFLAARLSHLSRMRIAHLVEAGACMVNGEVTHAGYHVRAGDVLEIALQQESAPNSMTPERAPLEIMFEDASLIVLVKPAGMLVHPTRGVKSGTLANALAYHLNRQLLSTGHELIDEPPPPELTFPSSQAVVRPGIVHRLDRATSGLMVVAKTQRALSILSRHFHQRLVAKRYVALVGGSVAPDEQLIDAPIGRNPARQPHWGTSADGKPSETRLRVIERRARTTLVELEPLTGRTNQLRIHCAHLGHPIVGDDWYGGESYARLCLHAARLAFHHPRGGDWLEFASPAPPEMSRGAQEFAA